MTVVKQNKQEDTQMDSFYGLLTQLHTATKERRKMEEAESELEKLLWPYMKDAPEVVAALSDLTWNLSLCGDVVRLSIYQNDNADACRRMAAALQLDTGDYLEIRLEEKAGNLYVDDTTIDVMLEPDQLAAWLTRYRGKVVLRGVLDTLSALGEEYDEMASIVRSAEPFTVPDPDGDKDDEHDDSTKTWVE
jgi:hypothetical protein